MADDKKSDDYKIDMPAGREFRTPSPAMRPPQKHHNPITENPMLSIIAYCGSSIMMTTTNKYVLSGVDFNLNFFLLCVQVRPDSRSRGVRNANRAAVRCLRYSHLESEDRGCHHIQGFQQRRGKEVYVYEGAHGGASSDETTGFPISILLIGMIYTSTWALKFLSIPVYTIFKNLTIILIAYGEVLWFGGSVTPMALFSFGLMVLSSIIAAWADIQHALASFGGESEAATDAISTLNAGYLWMMFNCLCTASYVLGMRKRIKLTNFKDFDSMPPPTPIIVPHH